MSTITIIGSGFSSLSAACYLAKAGHQVAVYEKNDQHGGRARSWQKDGFTFDMGPSWYWMPDVFERFFSDFGKKPSDYYDLKRLSPGYKVYFDDASVEISDKIEEIYDVFEKEESGSSYQLKEFLKEAKVNYEVSINNLVYKPGLSPMELVTGDTVFKLNRFFTSTRAIIRKKFKSEKLIKLLEFPVLFLGAKPQNTPSFYSFMNYADFALGTWYPEGGMHKVVEGMVDLGRTLDVQFHTNAEIEEILVQNGKATGISIDGKQIFSNKILSGADYHHTESLLPHRYRAYSQEYWDSKTFAPSALLFYVGFSKKLKNISHHILFFDKEFDSHAEDIYDDPKWPRSPLFYANFTSLTDKTTAPVGQECGFFLIPLAPGLNDTAANREKYFDKIIERLEINTNQSVKEHILFKRSYCVKDFKEDYHSYKGNAYGMANTLRQTAFLRPKIKSKKVKNLYFTGQLTVPGPGVPPAIISGKIAADQILKSITSKAKYESVI